MSSADAMVILKKIDAFFSVGDFTSIDKMFDELVARIDDATPLEMISHLRYTCVYKHKFASWETLLYTCYEELSKRALDDEKLNPNRLLKGLLQ